MSSDRPADEYARRLEARRSTRDSLLKREQLFANARLAAFALVGLVWWLAAKLGASWLWAVLPFVAFVGLVVAHDLCRRARERAARAVRFYELGEARLEQ